jgi:hypothetical protein
MRRRGAKMKPNHHMIPPETKSVRNNMKARVVLGRNNRARHIRNQ